MFDPAREEDVICAQATAPGRGGIAVIRVSGKNCREVVRKCASFLPESLKTHRAFYGCFHRLKAPSEPIDEVVVTYFAEGRSYTGEETLEISPHGNPVVVESLLQELGAAGARLAEPGEFTYRAFMNGRIDLVQAESVLNLIESESKKAARLAFRQLQGGLSQRLQKMEDSLTWILAHLEASIDFSTEDIEVFEATALHDRAAEIHLELDRLLDSYRQGKLVKDGLFVALVGQPNVGKSSLLNALAEEEKAIVTDVPGTTRDIIEVAVMKNGIKLRLFDTAGLRETEDRVEVLGIEKTRQQASDSDVVLYLFDPQVGINSQDEVQIQELLEGTDVVLVASKADLIAPGDRQRVAEEVSQVLARLHSPKDLALAWVSSLHYDGMAELLNLVLSQERVKPLEAGDEYLMQARHFEGLQKVKRFLGQGMNLLTEGASPEFVAFELQEALLSLHEVQGKEFDDQVMDRVFKEFCLGK